MTTPHAAAIYARISSDQTGEGLGVQRQLEDCRRLARERGWVVAEEYVDNDFSAYSGKTRPAYERMLSDVEARDRDAVIVYNFDRLTRAPIEFELFKMICAQAGLRHIASVTADIDVSTDDGMFMARVIAAVAAKESARRSERLKRKHQQLAEQGRPNGGHHRPFGYAPDRVSVVESEAQIIRELVARFLAGESMRSLATWLNEEGVAPVSGESWRTQSLRAMLMSGRIAGLREYRGQVVGEAAWPAIITPEQRRQVLARFAEKKATGRRAPRRYLLSGLLRCQRCGGRLYSNPRGDKRRYVCLNGPDHRGCGRLTITADPVEHLLAAAVRFRLDTPDLADALASRASMDERHASLVVELEADRAQLSELAGMYAARQITAEEWRTARAPITKRVEHAERQLQRASGTPAVDEWVGKGKELADRWATLPLERQALIMAAVLDHAVISPGVPGARGLDPDRVHPVWRL
ncbi:recombinase family protein [Georgenia sp. 10Sc9-8]|uniref:Recombinase family protein n=1 Tax=Georgenia halotolerans TaxID=3028317 RepID=A0ABT5TXF7_9MICO|nr:recombinase family protein [Georgenia halotolerans]